MSLTPQQQQALETVQLLWIAFGVLIASNLGTFTKIVIDHFAKKKLKEEMARKDTELAQDNTLGQIQRSLDSNTQAINGMRTDMQRLYSATKLLAGKKWEKISAQIQEQHPK